MVYSTNKRSDQDAAFLSHEVGKLVDQTVKAKSIAGQISQHFSTQRPAVDFPLFTTPVGAGFVGELGDLPLSNADTSSVTATAYKIAGATQASSEMLDDMDPAIAAQIGQSIADQIIWSLDTAVLGNTTTDGPRGLLSLASTVVDPGASLTNLDAFVKAVYAAQNATVPAKVTHFVMSPATAEALSLLKTGTGLNTSLLQFQQDGSILVAGVPILISSLVDEDTTAWAVDASHSRLVLRAGTEITKTYVPQNDSWFISGIARYGWVNLAPASVIRIYHDAA
ncbi:phage major capsid protein [Mycobacterium avium]|uniref:phage major capsid protein n=2 Tax=Mycobacterium avium TaxID=1764 RepID=UPI0007A095AA|nr:phage major capsid protein [Mycobacterium avium]